MGPSRRTCGNASRRHVDRCDARVPDQFSPRKHRRRVRRESSRPPSWWRRCASRSGRLLGARRFAGHLRAERDGARLRLHACAGADMERFRAHHLHPARPRLERDALGLRRAPTPARRSTMLAGRPRATARSISPISSASSMQAGVAWVAITGASNLTGWAPDLRAGADLTHAAGARIHVDAVARAPHLPIDVNGWGIDSLVTSPYKWYGPHAGILVLQPELLARCRALPCAARRLRRARPVGGGHEVVRGDRWHRRRRVDSWPRRPGLR